MSSSRAMAGAQQRRVTMQKTIAPVRNSNPRKSIASRGRFNAPVARQPQVRVEPQFAPIQQENMNYDPSPMMRPNKKIHVNHAVSILSKRITHIENVMYGEDYDGSSEVELDFALLRNQKSEQMDTSVFNAIIERLEKLEKKVQNYEELRQMIEQNTISIEEVKTDFKSLESEINEDESEDEDEEQQEETPQNNVNVIIEDVSDSEDDYFNRNTDYNSRVFIKPTF